LTRYVLDRALADYLAWRGPQGPGFSINLALSDLSDDAFAGHLSVALRDRGIQPDLITLECPMPPVTMAVEEAAAHFARLSETGVRLAIEVRGRANEFLKTVSPFPFDEIKTGGAAILRFARTVRGPGLSAISELLEIAKSARATIVAVGVEDQASLSALRSLGFSAAQGNHLAQVGRLADLPVEKINDVRQLLGLSPLSSAEISAIAKPAPAVEAVARSAATAAVEQTVERLSQRIARLAEGEGAGVPREQIKAALQAGDRAALTKAAAIAKAKRKGGAAAELGDLHLPEKEEEDGASAGPDVAPARKLFDRLSDAFDPPRAKDRGRADVAVAPDGARMKSEDPPQIPPPAPTTTRPPAALSLPVGAARAYFRQAMHVAALWPRNEVADSVRDTRGDLFEFDVDDLPKRGAP
ncbi:MAG: EAL domain-containing protein, partial [Parvularculaceae bacterium]|nr:EAL domain-containing protein [Parvularculaceae bacterium]